MNNQNPFVGSVPMVKIDGKKIRLLREEKGLTQLYLATAVEVTTDTISRWENRRYPAVKRENALKLAEALEVALEVILDEDAKKEPDPAKSQPDKAEEHREKPQKSLLVWLSISGFVVAAFLCFWWLTSGGTGHVSAVRVLPGHTPPEQPFPVVIKLKVLEAKSASLIVKESAPVATEVVQTLSATPAGDGEKKRQLKWIKKLSGGHDVAYMLKSTNSAMGETLMFDGTITVRRFRGSDQPIVGAGMVEIAPFHWADTNRDNRIDDQEILAVYDEYSEIEGLGLNMDLIEDIWFGSGYRWISSENRFDIKP